MGAKATPYNKKNSLKQGSSPTKRLTALEKVALERAGSKHPNSNQQKRNLTKRSVKA